MSVALVFGIFGLIIGSFLNVLILRYGERGIGGRSECFRCGYTLAWYDLIPVISWVALRGRCRKCHARISIQYPLVEGATAILFALIGAAPFPIDYAYQILFCAIAALLIMITVYDLYHTIIPDPWVWMFNGLAFLLIFFLPGHLAPGTWNLVTWNLVTWNLVWAILSGPIAALPLFLIWLISRGAWMGFGDVKLALGIGWLLGPILGAASVFFAFIIGGVVSAPLLVLSSEWWRRSIQQFTPSGTSRVPQWSYTMKSEIPFGPFLITSCLILWISNLYGLDLLAQLAPGLL